MPRLPPKAKEAKKGAGSAQDKVSGFHASRTWGKVRDSYRQLQPICERCRYMDHVTQESTEGLSVHHIVMIARCWAKRTDEDNLLTLCGVCHSVYSTLERAGKYNEAERQGREVKER